MNGNGDNMYRKLLATALLAAAIATPAMAIEPSVVNNVEGVALKGFDPVAYLVDGKATKGDSSITAEFQNVTYDFASKEHKELFVANPEKYIPTFNGFCATGVSNNFKVDIDPHVFAINDGKVDLFYNEALRDTYQADLKKRQAMAKDNWPAVDKMTKVIR